MYRQHFGLRCAPLDNDSTDLQDVGALAALSGRFQWLLTSLGIGLLTGEPGVGKIAALCHITRGLNSRRYHVIYLAETEFGRIDLYCSLARALGLEPSYRRADLVARSEAAYQ
jgi:MSHA biogenesis protein MshM